MRGRGSKKTRVGQGNGVRTLCHETALRGFANSGSGTLFWGWGSFENLLGGLFLGAGTGRASLPASAEFT